MLACVMLLLKELQRYISRPWSESAIWNDVNTDLKTTSSVANGRKVSGRGPRLMIFSRPAKKNPPHCLWFQWCSGEPATRWSLWLHKLVKKEAQQPRGDLSHFKAYNNSQIPWREGSIKDANVRSEVNYILIKESPGALKMKNTFSPSYISV